MRSTLIPHVRSALKRFVPSALMSFGRCTSGILNGLLVMISLAAWAQESCADERAAKTSKEKERAKAAAAVRVEAATARAEKGKNPQKAERPIARAAVVIPPEREAAALAFARENHPELAALLEGLKQNAPREYQAALVDLDRAVDRLGKSRERSAERHAFDLSEWKLTSRIRLLAARLTMSPDPAVEDELRVALRERLELRLSFQRTERDRLQTRVSKLDQQIEEMSSKADSIVEKQLTDLRKAMPAAKPAVKPKPRKPAEATGKKS